MNFLGWSNTLYRTLHVNLVRLAFTTMPVSPVLYTAISVFCHIASTGCLSCRDAACSLAFGPYTMQGVPSTTNLPPGTTGIVSIGSSSPNSMFTRWATLTIPILSLQHRTVCILLFTTTSTTPSCAASVLTVPCVVMSANRLFLNPWCCLCPELGLQ